MKPDDLAKYMRERALLIESDETLNERSLPTFAEVQREKHKRQIKLEQLKKLYFDAGRWVGGARDHTAREAYREMKRREQLR